MKSAKEVELFEKDERQLHVFYKEVSALSKKNANDGVNKFKLTLINSCLKELNTIMGLPLDGFESFDEALIPSNSDVALVLGQYVAAVYAFRVSNTKILPNREWVWILDKNRTVKTAGPYRFKYSE